MRVALYSRVSTTDKDQDHSLLATKQANPGKEILAALDVEIVLRPAGDHLNAEISGHLGRVFALVATKGERGSNSWLGEEDSNPR